jgi:hypothetical protein
MSPPPPPPPQPPAPPGDGNGMGALLGAIQGFGKGGLKRTVTVDKSSPLGVAKNNA